MAHAQLKTAKDQPLKAEDLRLWTSGFGLGASVLRLWPLVSVPRRRRSPIPAQGSTLGKERTNNHNAESVREGLDLK